MDGALKELQDLRQAASFAADISVIRVWATKAARARRDKATEQRVQKLCTETLELVTNYLDADKFAEFRNDLNDMRQIELDQAAVMAAGDGGEQKKPAPDKKNTSTARPKAPAAPRAAPPAAPGF
jgi:hypothetical protein